MLVRFLLYCAYWRVRPQKRVMVFGVRGQWIDYVLSRAFGCCTVRTGHRQNFNQIRNLCPEFIRCCKALTTKYIENYQYHSYYITTRLESVAHHDLLLIFLLLLLVSYGLQLQLPFRFSSTTCNHYLQWGYYCYYGSITTWRPMGLSNYL